MSRALSRKAGRMEEPNWRVGSRTEASSRAMVNTLERINWGPVVLCGVARSTIAVTALIIMVSG